MEEFINNLSELSFSDLSKYKEALSTTLGIYSDEVQPFYGMATRFELLTQEQIDLMNIYEENRRYFRAVSIALKNKAIKELKEIENGKNNKKSSKKD